MKCSVVLCSYNGGRFLREQLKSIVEQSRAPDEAILLDDHSGDDTWQILEVGAADLERLGVAVQLHRNSTNLGVNSNFARGIELARNDVIVLSDQDDRWKRDRILATMREFESDDALLCFNSNADIIDQDGRATGTSLFEQLRISDAEKLLLKHGQLLKVIPNRNLFTGATMAFRAKLRDLILPLHPDFIHDDWIASLASLTGKVKTTDTSLIDYRLHQSNAVGLESDPQSIAIDGENPRVTHLNWQLERVDRFVDRLGEKQLDHDAGLKSIIEFQKHLNARKSALSRTRLARMSDVFSEYLSGRYNQFSGGVRSAVSDLLIRHG